MMIFFVTFLSFFKKLFKIVYSFSEKHNAIILLFIALILFFTPWQNIWEVKKALFTKPLIFNKPFIVPCYIRDNDSTMNGKLGIVFYEINVVGNVKEESPKFVQNIIISVKFKNKWIKGVTFTPLQVPVKDCPGNVGDASILVSGGKTYLDADSNIISRDYVNSKDTFNIFFIYWWNNFIPNEKGIEFGRPSKYSTAAYFPIKRPYFYQCKEIKIVFSDYLNNQYKFVQPIKFPLTTLLQDTSMIHSILKDQEDKCAQQEE